MFIAGSFIGTLVLSVSDLNAYALAHKGMHLLVLKAECLR